jgi:hypothetical protein
MNTCEEFYQATRPNWTAGDWESLKSSNGSAVPLADTLLGVEVPEEGTNSASGASRRLMSAVSDSQKASDWRLAHAWRDFYTLEIGDLVYEMYRPDFESFGYHHERFSR